MSGQRSRNIPKIMPLRSQLGFTEGTSENQNFKRAYRKFINEYRSSNGDPGCSFIKWEDNRQRSMLGIMAKQFFEMDRRGPKFWPSVDGRSPNHENDAEEIVKLLAQLFFRHNLQGRSTKKRKSRSGRGRSQTFGRENMESPSIQNDSSNMDSMMDLDDRQNSDEESDDDDPFPPLSKLILSPNRANRQASTTGNQANSSPLRQGSLLTMDNQNVVTTSIESVEPVAPVAQMTHHGDSESSRITASAMDFERHTSSGQSCRPVQRENFVEAPNFQVEHDSRSSSPLSDLGSRPNTELGSRPSPELGSRPSPELGTDLAEASSANSPQHSRAVSEQMADDQPSPSVEDSTPPRDMSDDSRAMPPPPLPRTPAGATTTGTMRRLRHNIKYSVESPPGNFKYWEHYGRFSSISIAEFQEMHSFHDIISIQFVVKRRGKSWDDMVAKNDDVAFQDMKARFKDLIGGDLEEIANTDEKSRWRGYVPYEIWITPIRMVGADEGFSRQQTIAL